jgi:hypothetical protein
MKKHMVETVWLEETRLTPFKEDYTEVYVASEVDARIAELEKQLADAQSVAISLDTSNQRLRQKIDRLTS